MIWAVRRPVQCAEQFLELKIAFRSSFARSTHRILREGSSSKIKKCASRYSGVKSKISKCTFRYSGVRQNVWNKSATSATARGIQKSLFYHSFGDSTTTKWRGTHISPLFWTSDEREVTKGFAGTQKNLHFTTVLSVRRSLFAWRVASTAEKFAFQHSFERPTFTVCVKGCFDSWKICISPQFWASGEHEVTRGLSPDWVHQTKPTLRKKREEILKRSNIFEEQPFSQQLFSSAFLSSFLSSSSQQLFSAAFLSSSSQQLFPSYHLAVVRGWSSAINIILLWSTMNTFFERTLSQRFRENRKHLFHFSGYIS